MYTSKIVIYNTILNKMWVFKIYNNLISNYLNNLIKFILDIFLYVN